MTFLFSAISLLSFLSHKNILDQEKCHNQLFTAEEVLKKTSDNLNEFNSVKYLHERDYFTGDNHYFLKGNSFIDFNSTDTVIKLKYHITTGNYEYFFNGSETFALDKEEKTLQIGYKPTENDMVGGGFFYNSIVSLRRTLPSIINDKTINKKLSDTSINNIDFYVVKFSLYKKVLNNFGGYSPISEDRTFNFQFIISKNKFLPYMLIQNNDADEHASKITYSNIDSSSKIEEKSWFYSTYLPQYKIITDKKEIPLLSVGIEAPFFELPLFESDKTINTNEFKNKIVLVEFWIRNCGPCIESVPALNKLLEKYKNKGLELLAINAYDTEPTVANFVNKYGPGYLIAYKGEKVAKTYGVSAFPAIFILNKKGIIIYSGYFDYETVNKAIEKEIN